jgi:lipid-binding SYLF domain-containing protein
MMLFAGGSSFASDLDERLDNSAEVLSEVLNVPDGIPQSLLDKAACVIVIPSVKRIAFGFGASYGRGVMVCRSGKDMSGPWGAPVMYALEGGSFGFQLGGEASDFLLLVMNPRGVDSLLKSKVKLGGDVSAAGGPKGREATAETDILMRAEILTYARSRGLFAGVSLQGSTLRPDNDANTKLFGREVSARDIVVGKIDLPDSAKPLVAELQKASPKNLSG